jgi:hypothetical protein
MEQLAAVGRMLLPSMLDPSGLFAHKALRRPQGIQAFGTNYLYSAMSVIGLAKDRSDTRSKVHLGDTLDKLYALSVGESSQPTGVLAATSWALAAAHDPRSDSLARVMAHRLRVSTSSSMELGLVLSALAAVIDESPASREQSLTLAGLVERELLGRFSDPAQLFLGDPRTLRAAHPFRMRITSFASQVYPIHGLAELARVRETDPAQQIVRAADHVVETQGELGQWWWVYSPRSGRVLESYPVYSVHQHGMAFMALAPIQNLGLRTYASHLERGVQWLFGQNEIDTPLVDFDHTFISRCLQRRGSDADGLLGMSTSQRVGLRLSSWGMRRPKDVGSPPDALELELLDECRSYELGWLLYARSLVVDW